MLPGDFDPSLATGRTCFGRVSRKHPPADTGGSPGLYFEFRSLGASRSRRGRNGPRHEKGNAISMASKWEQELRVALEAVRAASRICRDVQSKIAADVFEKEDRSPVTVADFASQAAICRLIGDAFPSDPIIGEEESGTLRRPENAPFLERVLEELRAIGVEAGGEQACDWIDRGCQKRYAPRFWTLDPIDGTKGFLRQEQYAVSLALLVEGRIEVALLGCPNLPADGNSSPLSHSDGRGQGEGSAGSSGHIEKAPSPRPSPGRPGEGVRREDSP
jgi:Inositol monophosphatase family